MVNTKNESQIWAFLKGKGMSDGGASGVMGNLYQESGFSPTAENGIGAFGIAQWLGGRKTALKNYASSHNESKDSLDAQLNYMWQEMTNGQNGSVQALNSMGPSEASTYFMNTFERPGDNSGPARSMDALKVYKEFTGKTGTYTPDSSGSSSDGSPSSIPVNSDIISALNEALQIKNFSITNPLGSMTQDAGAISLRAVLVVVGLLAITFGMYAVVMRVSR